MNTSNSGVTIMAVGDIGPVYEPADQYSELVAPVLKQADIRIGQCERTYSEKGFMPNFDNGPSGNHSRLHPRMASLWNAAGIDVVSLASNHAMDWGPDAMLDTAALFRGMGKIVIGAGHDGDEARKPAIIERAGAKIAILSYCSVLRDGQAAALGKAGIAPLRVHTFYAPEEFQPGTPPRVITEAYETDVKAMEDDIRRAKRHADAVIVSMHWGLRHVPKTICTYQQPVAHAAIDAGADLILGHHAHSIKAIEVYKGKVCFYSIGNFMTTGAAQLGAGVGIFDWNLVWYQIDKECLPPNGQYHFPAHCRKTMIAKAVISSNGMEKVSFLPAFINHRAQPYVVTRNDPKFQEILDFTEWVSDQHPHQFTVEGDEIVIDTTASRSG
ncbi:MAG: CapA family protein [Betaproteobacteria bacterium]|nr:CapA family protein [Betaproteobacteria bacterium]